MGCQRAAQRRTQPVQTYVAASVASAVVLVVTASAGASSTTTASTRSTASAAVVGISSAVGVAVLADTVVGRLGSVVRSARGLITESCGGSCQWWIPGRQFDGDGLPCSEPVKLA